METMRRPAYNRQMYNGQTYVYGNTVRKPEVLPKKHEEPLQKQPKRISKQVRKNRKKAMHMNASYVVFLAVAAVITLVVCVNYLRLQSELVNNSKHITSLQRELAEKKEVNNTRMNHAMDSVNLEDVRKRAVESLGMTHAQAGQIITYRNPSENYVKQYKNIPENGVSEQADSAQ